MIDMTTPANPDLKSVPEPEVSDRPRRRRFSSKYKLAILRELDGCSEPGEVGAVLRREGLYSSHITLWRRAREAGELQALEPKKVGRPKIMRNLLEPEVTRLQRENAALQERLRKAEIIIEVQKKLSMLLNLPMPETEGRSS